MPLIEGVGDEVTQLFIVLIVIAVGIAAWCSTSISDQQPLRLLFLSEPQGQHQLAVQSTPAGTSNVSSSQREAADATDTGQVEETAQGETIVVRVPEATVSVTWTEPVLTRENNTADNAQPPSIPVIAETSPSTANTRDSVPSETAGTLGETDKTDIPADVSILRQRRLAFLQKQGNKLLESTSNGGGDVATNETEQKEESENLIPGGIRIRLKYLNDNQKLVQGSLQEPLGDFKRRHFAVELESNKIVRLVFNGQILQSDSETLQGYGLFDNCVVHCLVHSRHTSSPDAESTSNANAVRDQNSAGANGAYREWDLSHILYFTVGLVLGLAWYFHYQLAYLFNVASTLALLGLSTAFAISAVATYLPDTEEIRLIS